MPFTAYRKAFDGNGVPVGGLSGAALTAHRHCSDREVGLFWLHQQQDDLLKHGWRLSSSSPDAEHLPMTQAARKAAQPA